jgi:hypothetical protein
MAIARGDLAYKSNRFDAPAPSAISEMQMIKLFRIIGIGTASPAHWVIGQFDTAKDALAEYNSELRRPKARVLMIAGRRSNS